ncbi:hypothetical protein FRB94_010765 [Tulasnella sp. JGI-2019a]|nr:hypothetical protein FRB93_010010 [Tulasnella sp. JGI-2019a]KAG9010237.1 hypothetical protein FRB94_010765 [Tulasnella sp. JGI-2019a]
MKRGAEQQLTKDGRDEDEDDDPSTGFLTADPSVLAKRPMKGLPKRRGAAPSPAAKAADEAPAKPSFGGFGGFSGFGAALVPPAKASPFGNFGGFGSVPPPSGSLFGVSSNSAFQSAPTSKTSQMFGASLASASASLSSVKSTSNAPASSFFNPNLPSTTAQSSKITEPTPSTTTAAAVAKDPTVDYFLSLRGLNHSLLTMLERAIAEDPFVELPLEQITKTYAEHRKGIEKESGPNQKVSETSGPKPQDTKPSFSFGSAPTPAPAPTFTLPKPPAEGFFPLKPVSDAKTDEKKVAPPSTDQKSLFSFSGNTNTFSAPLFGSSSAASKADDKPKPPAPNFGSFLGFGQPAQAQKKTPSESEKSKENEKKEETPTSDAPGKASLYPFSALAPPPSSSPTPAAPTTTAPKPPVPSFFSFSSTPTATPAAIPPAPVPIEKRPSLSSFGFGSGSSTGGKSWSFGTPTPGGSLGNPVGFSFGSPPKDKVLATAPPPTAGTTAVLEAVAATSSSAPPASSVASVIDGSVGVGTATVTRESSVAVPVENGGSEAATASADEGDQIGEGEENEDTLAKARSKLYRFKDGAWADMGTGYFKLKQHKETGTKRVLMRNNSTGKVMLNFRVHSAMEPLIGIKPTIVKFTGHEDGQPVSFQARFKATEEAQNMKTKMIDLVKES